MKVLVAGSTGLLGRHVAHEARSRRSLDVILWSGRASADAPPHTTLHGDARTAEVVERVMTQARPDVVINCIGLTHQTRPSASDLVIVNSWFPRVLAELATTMGSRIVHVSTDAVFEGTRGHYSERDDPAPRDDYGRAKLLGEPGAPHLSVRTCFVGRREAGGAGLLDWLLRQTGTVPGFANSYSTCVGAPVLARVLLDLAARPDVTGVLHVPGKRLSKLELCRALARAFDRADIVMSPVEQPAMDRSLRSDRVEQLGIQLPTADEQWAELARLSSLQTS